MRPLPRSDFREIPGWVIDLQLRHPDQQIVIQLDEIDRLLAYDASRNESFFRMLRSLAQEKRCQFIFSGERTILDKMADPSSSFFNFVTPVYLGLLDSETTVRIVTDPMRLVGVTLEAESLATTIYEYTSGHPNLIQYVCRECLRRLSRQRTRLLTRAVVIGVLESSPFREQYLATYWSQATPIEKAISVCAAEKKTVTLPDIKSRLAAAGCVASIGELKRCVNYLILCQLLEADSDSYRIRPARFVDALAPFPLSAWLEDFLAERSTEKAAN